MTYHTEQKENEVFLGNSTKKDFEIRKNSVFKTLKTIRSGVIAFDIHGKKLNEDYIPLFLNKSEIVEHDRIMMKR